jgi:hypothetical protein
MTHELHHCGYRIRLYHRDDGWRVTARPLTPEQPILRRHSYFIAASSEEEASERAKRLVDDALAQWELSAKSRT